MTKLFQYLKTVHIHRKYVRKMCFKMGIPLQGLTHDLSKYSIKEMKISKYYGGDRSPHEICRMILGYSPNWLNHYHKNKHHWQYWLDIEDWPHKVIPIKMPYKYVIEMLCDMVGASKAYNRNKEWSPEILWNYWVDRCQGKRLMHEESLYLIEKLIWNYYQYGEEKFLNWYKHCKDWLKREYNKGTILEDLKRL